MKWLAHKVTEQAHIKNFFSLFKIHYENGFSFPGETHDFWECLYVLEGTACVSGDDRVYNLSEGNIIFHKPLELHKFYIDNKKGATLLIFSFTLDGTLSTYLQNKVFRLTNEQKNIIDSMLNYIQTQIEKTYIPSDTPVHRQYLVPFLTSQTYSQMIVTHIYQLLLSLADNGSTASALTTPGALLFSRIVNYMSDHIDSSPTVYEIAKACNTSVSSLKRIFAQYAGISVHKYFLKLKFKTASELLQSGMNVNEVAEKLGFSSQSYFSVSYKRETGINPSRLK